MTFLSTGPIFQIPAHPDFSVLLRQPLSWLDLRAQYEQKQKEVREVARSASAAASESHSRFVLPNAGAKQVMRSVQRDGIEDRVFYSLVALKVAVSRYAMHLSQDDRHRLFMALDNLLNPDNWYEEDVLPLPSSFVNFLKWMLYARNFDWESLGISDEGTILVAWLAPRVQLTADFHEDERVVWTSRVESTSGEEYAAGSSSLQYFSRQFRFFLDDNGSEA
jgi:hypothetical protein